MKIEFTDYTAKSGQEYKLVTVERRGFVYAMVYAEPFPTEAEVRLDFTADRRHHKKNRAFRPFDTSTRRFIA